jgi:DNA transformation protein and related proteins
MERRIDFVMRVSFRMRSSMSVSDNYRTYIIEQLAALPALSTRRMFGGLGLYSGDWFFGLIDDDVLFFKVDDANRDDYVSRGMRAFMPIPGKASMGYFQVPVDVIEEAEDLTRWARRSVEVAERAGLKKKKKKKKRVRVKPDPQKKTKMTARKKSSR